MSPESSGNLCGPFHNELLRLASGDVESNDVSSAFDAHLSVCSNCAQELAEARDTVGALSTLLRPEPLPTELLHQIREELDDRSRPAPRYRLRSLMLVGTAAAAALLAATFIPNGEAPDTTNGSMVTTDPIVQSTEDATAIVAAFNLLDWSDPLDYSLYTVGTTLDELEQTISGKTADSSLLPWGPEDDWDAPSADTKSPASAPDQPLGLHPQRPRDRLTRTATSRLWFATNETAPSRSTGAG